MWVWGCGDGGEGGRGGGGMWGGGGIGIKNDEELLGITSSIQTRYVTFFVHDKNNPSTSSMHPDMKVNSRI